MNVEGGWESGLVSILLMHRAFRTVALYRAFVMCLLALTSSNIENIVTFIVLLHPFWFNTSFSNCIR